MPVSGKTTRTRKTKGFYQQAVLVNKTQAFIFLKEIIKKYGHSSKWFARRNKYYLSVNDNWNNTRGQDWKIEGFILISNKIYVDVYWQGDSTDGNEWVEFKGDLYDNLYIEPSDPIKFGGRWEVARQGITISTTDIYNAIKNIIWN